MLLTHRINHSKRFLLPKLKAPTDLKISIWLDLDAGQEKRRQPSQNERKI